MIGSALHSKPDCLASPVPAGREDRGQDAATSRGLLAARLIVWQVSQCVRMGFSRNPMKPANRFEALGATVRSAVPGEVGGCLVRHGVEPATQTAIPALVRQLRRLGARRTR